MSREHWRLLAHACSVEKSHGDPWTYLTLACAGASPLQVMLKDLADSKRVNANIKALPEQALSPLRRARRATDVAALDATVISALFWPPIQVRAHASFPFGVLKLPACHMPFLGSTCTALGQGRAHRRWHPSLNLPSATTQPNVLPRV